VRIRSTTGGARGPPRRQMLVGQRPGRLGALGPPEAVGSICQAAFRWFCLRAAGGTRVRGRGLLRKRWGGPW